MSLDKNYDCLIIGGGLAGVAAAIQAGRCGLRTALVEKTILWGGLCTSGLVPIYMPLCDGRGRQVTFGLAEELLKLSTRYGPGGVPGRWLAAAGATDDRHMELYPDGTLDKRYMTIYSPVALVFALDEALEQSGVELWLDTLACQPIVTDGGRVGGVEVENKSGRLTLRATCTIDATGDADIAARAGAPCLDNAMFPSILYQYTSLALAEEAVKGRTARRVVTWRGGASNEWGVGYNGPLGKLHATNGKDVSAFALESRRVARVELAKAQAEESARAAAAGEGQDRGRENIYPATLPTMNQFRMSRSLRGRETVEEARKNQRVESSIGMMADCRKVDAVWEIPFGSMVPTGLSQLLVAGRCIAAEGYAWQVTRLIPPAVLTGQVAALAVDLAIRGRASPERLDVKDVQKAAEAQGIVLHL